MTNYRPPHSPNSFIFAGTKASKRMSKENADYKSGFNQGKGRRDGSKR